jgi:hypothetical protein
MLRTQFGHSSIEPFAKNNSKFADFCEQHHLNLEREQSQRSEPPLRGSDLCLGVSGNRDLAYRHFLTGPTERSATLEKIPNLCQRFL